MRRRLLTALTLAGAGFGLWCLLFPSTETVTAAEDDGPLLVVYSEPDFGGHSLRIQDTVVDLPVVKLDDGTEFDWNDSIRSLRVVRGVFRAWQHGRCNTELDDTPLELLELSTRELAKGWSSLLSATSTGALELASTEAGGVGEDISSIELVSEKNLPDWAAP